MIKFSIITACKNSRKTIKDTLDSVSSQNYPLIEHVIKDGLSTDGTDLIVQKYASDKLIFISNNDSGIYDAMNQGYKYSTGDVISFLNSDDYYASNSILQKISKILIDENIDYVYGDIDIINKDGGLLRRWQMGSHQSTMKRMKQIAHPALFIRRETLNKISPCFDSTFKIAADLKQQLILIHNIKAVGYHLPEVIAIVRTGGESTRNIKSYIVGWLESYRAYDQVFGLNALKFTINKVLHKFLQLLSKRP